MLLASPGAQKQDEEGHVKEETQQLSDQTSRDEELERIRMGLLDEPRQLARLHPAEGLAKGTQAGADPRKESPGAPRCLPEKNARVVSKIACMHA